MGRRRGERLPKYDGKLTNDAIKLSSRMLHKTQDEQ
jgi:hypothetical protein